MKNCKKKILLFVVISILQGGCMQDKKKTHIPQEGEVVTWRQNQQLIVKARLGPRRAHIPDQFDYEFHPPESEHYVGQFPIDYMPDQFAKISEQKATALPKPLASQQLEFNLMLNGSNVQATDQSINSEEGLDHIDQVKVMVFNDHSKNDTGQSFEIFEKSGEGKYDKTASLEYGLNCYVFEKTNALNCFGKSDYSKVSGVSFKFMDDRWVFGESWEPIYGGIKVQWRIDSHNLKHWKEVDAAIWRLLEAWNVSPFNNIAK